MSSFYSAAELEKIGFAAVGENVKVSRNAAIYSPEKISLGSNVRIDDFVFLSGGRGITIGNYVHIAVAASLYGKFGIEIGDYVNVSGRVSIYSSSDDYSGEYMTGPLVGEKLLRQCIRQSQHLFQQRRLFRRIYDGTARRRKIQSRYRRLRAA